MLLCFYFSQKIIFLNKSSEIHYLEVPCFETYKTNISPIAACVEYNKYA